MSDFSELASNLARMSQENTDRKFHEDDLEDYWNDLSEREREKAFYCVVSMLNELREDGLAMRETLYDTFGFKSACTILLLMQDLKTFMKVTKVTTTICNM